MIVYRCHDLDSFSHMKQRKLFAGRRPSTFNVAQDFLI
jgi:hypothetical protein